MEQNKRLHGWYQIGLMICKIIKSNSIMNYKDFWVLAK